MSECIFCRIVSGQIPATKVGETDQVLAIRDLNPQAPTHVLLIPKQHLDSAAAVGTEHGGMMSDLFGLASKVADQEGLRGWRLVTNVGPEAGQSVLHLHFHLLGGRTLGWPPG